MGHPVFIRGVQIDFPYPPYECQTKYMTKVIECLQEKKNGLLESPTGTGKTVSLLCAALAWQETYVANMQLNANEAANSASEFKQSIKETLDKAVGFGETSSSIAAPKIIYASRTHSQLSQVVRELKRTSYRPRVCVLGSRDQMCINNDVLRLIDATSKVYACKAKVSSRSCMYYNNVEPMKKDKSFSREILDIEDLGKLGKQQGVCPYFMSRELKSNADLILMPYNYVLDFKTRKSHGIDLNNTIVLLDEAHNVEKVCEDASSFDLTSFDLASVQTACDECHRILTEREDMTDEKDESQNDRAVDLTPEDVVRLKSIFQNLEKVIDSVPVGDGCFHEESSYLFNMLKEAKIDSSTVGPIVNALENCNMLLLGNATKSGRGRYVSFQKVADVFKVLFFRTGEVAGMNLETGRYYKVVIQNEKVAQDDKRNLDPWDKKTTKTPNTFGRKLGYWCFRAGITMTEIMKQGVRSLILTSGTLSPLNSFAYELDIPFKVELQNSHVITPGQIWAGVIGKGPGGVELNSSYQTRSQPKYIESMGELFLQIAKTTPQGLLVFFPSYHVMDFTFKNLVKNGILSRIEESKPVFVEPKSKRDLADQMQAFYAALKDPAKNGAVFFAICRGKVSEGLDFADQNGRVVVVAGIPYPSSQDEKVKLKQEFLDKSKSDKCQLRGFDWYRQQATRAVNQAIGRVIRHKNDYGAILLCDHRFSQTYLMNELPEWIRRRVKLYNNFDQARDNLITFFRSIPGSLRNACDRKEELPGPSTANGIKQASRKLNSGSRQESHAGESLYNSAAANSLAVLRAGEGTSEKSSIFEHLSQKIRQEETQKGQQERSVAASFSSSYFSAGLEAGPQPKAKRLKIVSRKASDVEKSSTEAKPLTSRDKVKEYIQTVKSISSIDDFRIFKNFMVDYKEYENIDHLLKNLTAFFKEKKEHVHLIKQHALLIRNRHFDLFKTACVEFIESLSSNENTSVKPQSREDFFPELSDTDESDKDDGCEATIKPQCVVCLHTAKVPFQAPCKHIACCRCMTNYVKMFNKCPKCKVNVRHRELKKILFY